MVGCRGTCACVLAAIVTCRAHAPVSLLAAFCASSLWPCDTREQKDEKARGPPQPCRQGSGPDVAVRLLDCLLAKIMQIDGRCSQLRFQTHAFLAKLAVLLSIGS